jgi:uncharacterized protein
VRPGGTVQFAAGTYRLGGRIEVSVTGVVLLGSPAGTTLRGCDPAELVNYDDPALRSGSCAGLELTGARQTVRNLTFEHVSWASLNIIGGRDGQRLLPAGIGGHIIEGNTFRDSDSFNVVSDASEPIVIRGNSFVNTYHAVAIQGRNVHFLDNVISAPDPQRIPYGRADIAVGIAQFRATGPPCGDNLIAGNRIDGHPEGIAIAVFAPEASCRRNIVRDNTIAVARTTLPAWERLAIAEWAPWARTDSIAVGVAIRLLNYPRACQDAPPGLEHGPMCPPDGSGQEALLSNNLIEGNRVLGGEGIAIEVLYGSGNRIVDNTISGITAWERFPGAVLRHPPQWARANGAGVWISAGSDENEIAGNTFADITTHAIVLEGDRNTVEARSAGDAVRDLGSGNRVSGPATAMATDATPGNVPARRTVDAHRGARRGPIIDMHLHAAAIRSSAHADSVLEWMDRHGVARALLLVHDTAGLGWRDRAPDRFVAAVSFPCHEGRQPETQQPCLAEWSGWPDPDWLRRQHAIGRLGALGELFNVYYGIPATHERLAPYWALAEELDIPVGVHTGRGPPPARRAPGCCPDFDDDYGDPALLEPVLRRHPKLRVWLMHAGGPFQAEAIALMQAFPNVYADMSILNSMAPPAVEAHSLRAFLDAGLGDRIMLGTDNQPIERILERMDAIDFLSETQRRAILYDNAARFLRLSPEEIARHPQQPEPRVAR